MIWSPLDMRLDDLDDRTLADIGLIRRDRLRALIYDVVDPVSPRRLEFWLANDRSPGQR